MKCLTLTVIKPKLSRKIPSPYLYQKKKPLIVYLFNNTLYICILFCINIQNEYIEGTIGCHLRYYTNEGDK